MISSTRRQSVFRDALRLYDFNRYKAFAYLVVLTLGTSVALILDIGLGVPQEKVLLYLAPFMVLFFLATTAACLAAGRFAFSRSGELARSGNRLLQTEFDVRHAIETQSQTGSMPELRDLRDQAMGEVMRMIHEVVVEAVAEELKTTSIKRTFRYSPNVRAKFSGRSFNPYRR